MANTIIVSPETALTLCLREFGQPTKVEAFGCCWDNETIQWSMTWSREGGCTVSRYVKRSCGYAEWHGFETQEELEKLLSWRPKG